MENVHGNAVVIYESNVMKSIARNLPINSRPVSWDPDKKETLCSNFQTTWDGIICGNLGGIEKIYFPNGNSAIDLKYFKSLSELSFLQEIDFSSTTGFKMVYGSLPSEWKNITTLNAIKITNNQISGKYIKTSVSFANFYVPLTINF